MRERGSVLVEFTLSMIAFLGFLYGLIGVTLWGLGAQFVQDAAHEATRKYAVTLEEDAAEKLARTYIGRWAFPFVDPETVSVSMTHDDEKAYGTVSAEPRVKYLFPVSVGRIEKSSSCVLEYRFRPEHREEFAW